MLYHIQFYSLAWNDYFIMTPKNVIASSIPFTILISIIMNHFRSSIYHYYYELFYVLIPRTSVLNYFMLFYLEQLFEPFSVILLSTSVLHSFLILFSYLVVFVPSLLIYFYSMLINLGKNPLSVSLFTWPPCIASMLNIGGWSSLPWAEPRGALGTVHSGLRDTLYLPPTIPPPKRLWFF